jgi:hypothetical protein
MQSDLDLLDVYRRLVRGWVWIVLAGIIGGVFGLLLSYARTPIYQASATIAIGIDHDLADVPDDITVRQAFDRVRGLLLADDTLARALVLAGTVPDGDVAPDAIVDLRATVRLAEEPAGWELIVTGRDPAVAERTAQAWAEAAVESLGEASLHAIRAAEWQGILYEASCTLVPGGDAAHPAIWRCRSAPPGGSSDSIPESLLAEVRASRGIIPAVHYDLLRSATGTSRAVVWSRGTLILGCALLGVLVGGAFVSLRRRLPEPAS